MYAFALHTVTLIYDRETRKLFIDRATTEEATKAVKWLHDGYIKIEDGVGFLINSTYYTLMSDTKRFHFAYLCWIDTDETKPFFAFRGFEESKGITQDKNQKLKVFEMCVQESNPSTIELAETNERIHLVDLIPELELPNPKTDLVPSVPSDLEVEKDIQLKTLSSKARPSFIREDGSYDAELHKLNCDELAQFYPHTAAVISEATQQKFSGTIRQLTTAMAPASMTPDTMSDVDKERLTKLVQATFN